MGSERYSAAKLPPPPTLKMQRRAVVIGSKCSNVTVILIEQSKM